MTRALPANAKSPSPPPLSSSRLVRFLSDLAVSNTVYTTKDFGARLGSLINFADSIALSAAHGQLLDVTFEKNTEAVEGAQQRFLDARASLVEAIVKSTTPGTGHARLSLPKLTIVDGEVTDDLMNFEPYHRFYATHQSAMDAKLKTLRVHLREEISGCSPELAQLAELDAALDATLLAQTRRFFSVIPALLQKHYKHLVSQQRQKSDEYLKTTSWLVPFYKDMQQLLLAELEMRLQPLLGLLEALSNEVETVE